MDVSPGYKQTEIGVIPEDWCADTLGPHVDITSGESPSRFRFSAEGTPYFKVEQLNNDRKYLSITPYFITGKRKVRRGSLIFPKRGASILLNKVRILAEDSFMDTNLMTLTPTGSAHPEFLYYVLSYVELWRIADTTSIPQINNKHIVPLHIPLPPTLAEQEAIAQVLSDADGLIESLEQLLTKKRRIKKGAVQELLSGKRRLRGYSREWEVKRLGQLGSFLKGRGVAREESTTGHLACVRYGELYTRHNNYVENFHSWISEEVAATATPLVHGDILFAGSGETKEDIGKCAAIVGDVEAFAGGDIVILRNRKADPLFLGYYLNTEPINRQKSSKGQGDAVVHVGADALADIICALPEISEQRAIARILLDMDTEIVALEEKLSKVRLLKEGMMHELLTGRMRLQ